MNPMDANDEIASLTSSDYDLVTREYAEHCIAVPGVSAIFQFGNIGAPGLSDIDLLVVLDDDAETEGSALAPLSIRYERWERNPLFRACFIHDVYVCPRAALAHVDYLMPGNTWRLRAGDAEQPALPHAAEREMIALVHGLDFCIGRLQSLAQLDESSPWSVRSLIPQLWSLTHTQRTLVSAGAHLESSWADVIDALEMIRAVPVRTLRSRDISRLISPVREHFALAVDHFATILGVRGGLAESGPKRECSIALHPRRALYVYDSVCEAAAGAHTSATPLSSRFRFGRRAVEARWTRLNLPGLVLSHHLTYLAQEPKYERVASRIAMQGRLHAGETGNDLYRRILAHRWAAARASERLIMAGRARLSGFGIPGLPVSRLGPPAGQGTLKFRAVLSWLDWRVIPPGAIRVKAG